MKFASRFPFRKTWRAVLILLLYAYAFPLQSWAAPMRDSNSGTGLRLVIEREINGTWRQVIASRRDVWVGQRISLRAKMSNGAAITGASWSVPGSRVANYEATQSETTKTELTNLNSTSVIFKWYDKGNDISVTFTGTSGGRTRTKAVVFNVRKPESYLTTIAGGDDRQVTVTNLWGNGWELAFGTPSAWGIVFKGDITTSVPGATLKWYQVVTSSDRRYLEGPGWHYYRPTRGVDKFVYPQDPAGGPPIHARDAPGQGLSGTWSELRINDTFTMWLMFQPPGDGSIFVPLRSVDWFWNGRATNNGGWSLASGSSSINPSSSESATLPEWEDSIQPGGYVYVP